MHDKELESYCPGSREDWRNWLEENHRSRRSVWLVYYKTSTNVASVTWSEAVEEALCFGWIDSTKKTIDHERYMQYFSSRNPKSTWSRINKEKVEMLIQNNRMTKTGFESIEVARQNGTWYIMDEVEDGVIPGDLRTELVNYEKALDFFQSQPKSIQKGMLHWVVTARRTETRKKRIAEIARSASKCIRPKGFR